MQGRRTDDRLDRRIVMRLILPMSPLLLTVILATAANFGYTGHDNTILVMLLSLPIAYLLDESCHADLRPLLVALFAIGTALFTLGTAAKYQNTNTDRLFMIATLLLSLEVAASAYYEFSRKPAVQAS